MYRAVLVAMLVMSCVCCAVGGRLRASDSLQTDPCFATHLNKCGSCIVDGSGLCGYCHDGMGKCASVVGDAHKPTFRCKDWTKPNLPFAPTTCARSKTATTERVKPEPVVQRSVVDTALKKEVREQVHDKDVNVSSPALDLNIVKEQPVKHKEKSKPVVYRKRIAQERVQRTVKPQQDSSNSTGVPAMNKPEMQHFMHDIVNSMGIDSEIMQHERIEWDNAHRQDPHARDGRHIDWEALKKHNEGNQEKRTELHYLQKEENERVKELLQKRNTAENTLKHRIADRDIPLTENQAVNHPVNANDILDKSERPDHEQYNKYLREKDKELNRVVGASSYARLHAEHYRYKANEVDDDDTTPIAMTKKQLLETTNQYNDMEGHLNHASYTRSIDPAQHNFGQKGYW